MDIYEEEIEAKLEQATGFKYYTGYNHYES